MTSNFDEQLAKVDGEPFCTSDLISHLKCGDKRGVLQDAIVRFLLKRAYEQLGITAAQDEIEQQMDEYRAKRGLLSAAATKNWLEERHLTDEEFVELIAFEVQLRKLKDRLADGKIEEKFAYEKLNLDRVELYRIVVEDESVAKELLAQIRDGESFFSLAKTHSVDEQTRRQCGYLGMVRRRDLKPEVESLVFSAKRGDTVGPVKSGGKFHAYLVEDFLPARLDAQTREFIGEEIFREWLDTRVRNSSVNLLI